MVTSDPADGRERFEAMSDVAERLEDLDQAGLRRELRTIDGPQGRRVTLDGREVLLLCSNNYLGLANHPEVTRAACAAALHWGPEPGPPG